MLPPKEIMDRTYDIIQSLDYDFDIFFTGRNTIQLQCELDDRSYLEIEIFKDHTKVFIVPKRIYSAAITKILSGDKEIEDVTKIVENFLEEKF